MALQFETPWICGRVFVFPLQFALLSFLLAVSFLRNWKTIVSLTIICHSISVFLAKKDRTLKHWQQLEEIDLQSRPVWQDFTYDQSAHENWTHISLSCILVSKPILYFSSWIINLLLDGLVCSILRYFYSSLVFWLALWARQNTTWLVKISHNTTE